MIHGAIRLGTSFLVIALGICSGCGGGNEPLSPDKAPKTGPHGSLANPIGEVGFVEVVREGGFDQVVLAVYFLSLDLESPMSPLPSNVTLDIKTPVREMTGVSIRPQGTSGDETSGRYATAPGDYDYDEISGTVYLTIDGDSLEVPFAVTPF